MDVGRKAEPRNPRVLNVPIHVANTNNIYLTAMNVDFLLSSTNLFYCEGLVCLYSNNTKEFVI